MMTAEENDLLCRVEDNAPMGQIMRRHWIAACLSEEVAEPDGAPIKVRLLGEDLVVFRDSKGRVGVLDEYCSHRRASLLFARNEECGLRCLYHGWKFDVDGNVVEMASEPANSLDEARFLRVIIECLSYFPDGSIQSMVKVDERIRGPEMFLQLFTGDELVRVFEQQKQGSERTRL